MENELRLRFDSKEEMYDFQDWLKEYGQYLYAESTGNSIANFDSDEENLIINF